MTSIDKLVGERNGTDVQIVDEYAQQEVIVDARPSYPAAQGAIGEDVGDGDEEYANELMDDDFQGMTRAEIEFQKFVET